MASIDVPRTGIHVQGPRRMSASALCLGLLVLLAGACSVQTDRTEYVEGETGVSTFENGARSTVYLGGCTHFVQQSYDGEGWVDRGGEWVCFWEGFAQPVPPQTTVEDTFTARSPGRWRLAYEVGLGCSADAPLSECALIDRSYSNPFDVVAASPDAQTLCETTGGIWHPASCGDWDCGEPPICLAIIPGCDCGPAANFVGGEGCVPDPGCRVAF